MLEPTRKRRSPAPVVEESTSPTLDVPDDDSTSRRAILRSAGSQKSVVLSSFEHARKRIFTESLRQRTESLWPEGAQLLGVDHQPHSTGLAERLQVPSQAIGNIHARAGPTKKRDAFPYERAGRTKRGKGFGLGATTGAAPAAQEEQAETSQPDAPEKPNFVPNPSSIPRENRNLLTLLSTPKRKPQRRRHH